MKPILLLLFISANVLSSCGNTTTSGKTNSPDSTVNTKLTDSTTKTMSTHNIKEEAVTYTIGGTTFKSFVTYDEASSKQLPIVLVVPEWWGLTEYPRMRAKLLASMGYLAVAVDMYGDGMIAANPGDAQKAATPFYTNPQLGKERLDAALAKAKTFGWADTSQVIAIGYCFGGSMVLNYAKLGAPVAGVVSFHGGLEGVPPQKGLKTKFLVCHGGADSFVPPAQVAAFKKSMDSSGVDYKFKVYEGATHAFTNPKATETGEKFKMPIQYNGAADTASWNDMKAFFETVLH